MDVNAMIEKIRSNPQSDRMGMVASHLGIVRENSLRGGRVAGIEVEFDQGKITEIIQDTKSLEGIIDVLVEVCDGRLNIGDAIMAVAVGGDIRERVFPALIETVNRIKSEASNKREIF